MSNESDRRLFEEAIRANPYDSGTRHVFADWLEEHGYDDEAVIQRSWTPQKQQAEEWLNEYAREHNLAFADLIGAANHFLDTDDTIRNGVDLSNVFFDPDRWKEFWQRFTLVTGLDPENAKGDVRWHASMQNYPGYESPCSECPWENEIVDRDDDDPYGDDFHEERGW